MLKVDPPTPKKLLSELNRRINESKTDELKLLSSLSHEISNLINTKVTKLKRTFVLTPWASSLFGLEIDDKMPYLGVPYDIYEHLSKCRLYAAYYIIGNPGLYLVMESSDSEKSIPIALRINTRTSQINSISKFKKLKAIKMRGDNTAVTGFDKSEFLLELKGVDSPEWEKIEHED